MSYKILPYNAKIKLPPADMCLEEVAQLEKILPNLSPRIEGKWHIQIVNPTIKESKHLLNSVSMPNWIDINLYLQQKTMEQVLLDFPEYMEKEKPFKEQAKELLAGFNHIIDKKAFNTLVEAFRGNIADFQRTLMELDEECKGTVVTLKDVQEKVNYTRPVYASDVLNAFLMGQRNRWQLLNKLRQNLGDSYAYNALYKYSRTLLKSKAAFLRNEDVKLRVVKRIDAPSICYAYTLFRISSNYMQLYGIFHALDNRGEQSLERIANVNLQ